MVTIRPATPLDENALVQFNLAMAFETEAIRLDEPTLRRGVRAGLADPHKGFFTPSPNAGEMLSVRCS